MKRKSGFLTFCLAFCPGAGQMYQGYMKRGTSLVVLFMLIIMPVSYTHLRRCTTPKTRGTSR